MSKQPSGGELLFFSALGCGTLIAISFVLTVIGYVFFGWQ